ncbi:ferredoxin--NADP reductase, root isozyme 2, chloroplastic-like [Humulus lupulus]|uniref:ferredoxin--NADP reductase, root isozyme 2, chloroplastic-like n=1 Tax=Humulus lupulus TaxID=3486 RepID=UPI002B4060BD|nr:ferredoxin--NADP reductase, root isozyme 2, chloroplastic-like [Humulus lupulus]
MALLLTQTAATSSLVSDRSLKLRTSLLLKTANLSSFEKRTPSAMAFNIGVLPRLPTRVATAGRIVCAVPQGGKVPVAPSELEHAMRPPTNLYTVDSPHTATILSVKKISGSNAPAETYHIVLVHDGSFPHWEGQVFGVMPAPENPFEPGDTEMLSYFSGASSRYGDYFNGRTVSLCVRLVPGTTSEILCNSKPGDKIQLTGPTREAMILGDNNPNATHIFVATGTGIAPFRAHLRRFFKENIPTFTFSGHAWLFHGVSNEDSKLYNHEFIQYRKEYPENFRYDIALSREQKNSSGGKMYVQDLFRRHATEVLVMLFKGAYIYLAGRKDMVTPIEDALRDAATEIDKDWDGILATLKKNNQWRVEVY